MTWQGWPADVFERRLGEVALRAAPLLVHPHLWINRRKETVEFIDARRIRRRVSLDFTLPHSEQTTMRLANVGPAALVPLAMLEKAPLRGFSVTDENGRALPVLTRQQNGRLSAEMLSGLARAVLGASTPLPKSIEHDLSTIACSSRVDARDALSRLRAQSGGASAQRATLWSHQFFRHLAEGLVENFVLLVQLAAEPGERRIVKFEYETHLPFRRTSRGAITRFLGFGSLPFGIPTPSASHAASYHLEVGAPPGLIFESAELRNPDQSGPHIRCSGGELIHLVASPPKAEAPVYAHLSLRQAPSALLTAAAVLAGATALWLLCAAWWLPTEEGRPTAAADAVTALFLAGPGLLLALIFRPGQHLLSLALYRGTHVLIMCTALMSLVAPSLLVLDVSRGSRAAVWTTMGILSGAVTLLLVAALIWGTWVARTTRDV